MTTRPLWTDAQAPAPHCPEPAGSRRSPAPSSGLSEALSSLPPQVEAAIWRAAQLGAPVSQVVPSGWHDLDVELPGGGWPCGALTEILQTQPSVCEWRLLAPSLRQIVAAGQTVVVVGPPKRPHLPGLLHAGLDDRQFVWVQVDTPAQRLWVTEQLVKSNACGALLAWLPQARPEQLRRLQVCAQACEGLVVLFRPEAARHEASAAPLRVITSFDLDWAVRVQILKRKGPAHEGTLKLPSVPGGLESVLTPRLRVPSRLIANRERADALGSAAPRQAVRRRLHS